MIKKLKTQGTALVTGAAKRIGKAICLSLSSQGFNIALHYNHSSGEAKKLSEEIRSKGGRCQSFCCDLSDQQRTKQLISDVLEKFSDLNVLINNASIFEPSTIANSKAGPSRQDFAVNFDAPFILTSQFAKKRKKGHIINILDTHIVNNSTHHSTYLLSKKALLELTRLSAVELAPNIRVNAISPGLILPTKHSNSDYFKRLSKHIPLQKKGNVGQIAQTVLFLLSNPYITGQNIFVDGGEHLI
jgi:NAD(P)-dependent dehydrogenase (short-subunit alcohol dehydrogenase family)